MPVGTPVGAVLRDEIALRKRFEGICEQFGVHKMANRVKHFIQEQGITEGPKTARLCLDGRVRRVERSEEPETEAENPETEVVTDMVGGLLSVSC